MCNVLFGSRQWRRYRAQNEGITMVCHSVGLEPLESRQLFAGVSLLTHGWNGRLPGFVNHAAAEITTRLGGPSHVAQYTVRVDADSDGNLSVTSVTHKSGTAT